MVLFLMMMATVLTRCGFGSDFKIKMTKPLYFGSGKEMPFEILVVENGKPIKGLDVTAQIEMANMDHGTIQTNLLEGKNGTYPAPFPQA